jgi:hypothetical protein
LFWIDERIDDDPRSSSEFSVRRDVDDDRLLVLLQPVDDFRAKFDHLEIVKKGKLVNTLNK